MAIVNYSELYKHACDYSYALVRVNASALPVVRGVLQAAEEQDAAVLFSVKGAELHLGLLPSLEMQARQASVPVALLATRIENTGQATLAMRLGCNALVLAPGLSAAQQNAISQLAVSCGVPLVSAKSASQLVDVDADLASATLAVLSAQPASWIDFDTVVSRAAANHLRAVFGKMPAAGKGRAALKACSSWNPVEHLIIYNTTKDEATSDALAKEGRRVLDKIPGVRATWSGRAVKTDAKYQWCWLIRFAHPAVIDSYRDHPDHVAYADNFFRPAAGDRISIDYRLTGADETES